MGSPGWVRTGTRNARHIEIRSTKDRDSQQKQRRKDPDAVRTKEVRHRSQGLSTFSFSLTHSVSRQVRTRSPNPRDESRSDKPGAIPEDGGPVLDLWTLVRSVLVLSLRFRVVRPYVPGGPLPPLPRGPSLRSPSLSNFLSLGPLLCPGLSSLSFPVPSLSLWSLSLPSLWVPPLCPFLLPPLFSFSV